MRHTTKEHEAKNPNTKPTPNTTRKVTKKTKETRLWEVLGFNLTSSQHMFCFRWSLDTLRVFRACFFVLPRVFWFCASKLGMIRNVCGDILVLRCIFAICWRSLAQLPHNTKYCIRGALALWCIFAISWRSLAQLSRNTKMFTHNMRNLRRFSTRHGEHSPQTQTVEAQRRTTRGKPKTHPTTTKTPRNVTKRQNNKVLRTTWPQLD